MPQYNLAENHLSWQPPLPEKLQEKGYLEIKYSHTSIFPTVWLEQATSSQAAATTIFLS